MILLSLFSKNQFDLIIEFNQPVSQIRIIVSPQAPPVLLPVGDTSVKVALDHLCCVKFPSASWTVIIATRPNITMDESKTVCSVLDTMKDNVMLALVTRVVLSSVLLRMAAGFSPVPLHGESAVPDTNDQVNNFKLNKPAGNTNLVLYIHLRCLFECCRVL